MEDTHGDDGTDPATLRAGLEQFGLSTYQARVYTTLLEHGALPAVEVAKRGGVPNSRVYDVLAELEREGYVETFEREDKRHARATEPSAVVTELRDTSDRLSETATSIEDRWERANLPDHQITLLGRPDSAVEEAERLIRGAGSLVDLSATAGQYHRLEGALRDALDDGVVVRASVEGLPDTAIDSEQPVTELRRRTIPGPFVAIVDRTITCFAPNERETESYGIVLDDSILSFVFHWYYQTCLWSIYESVYRRTGDRLTYVSVEEFVRDVYPAWREGALVPVTVTGRRTDTDEYHTMSGVLTDVLYPDFDPGDPEPPSYGELAGRLTLLVSDGDRRYSVGGWGASLEDVEARTILVDPADVLLDPAAGSDA